MKVVLFACVHNAGRSQMAACFFNHLANPHAAQAISAGTQPAAKVHPAVQEVMQEIGLALPTKPQLLTAELAQTASLLVTMGCGDACPVVRGLRRSDWPLPDPKERPLEEVRQIRQEIKTRVENLLRQNGWHAQAEKGAKRA